MYRGYFLSTRKNSEFWILERVDESRKCEKKVEEFYLHRVCYNRFSMPAASRLIAVHNCSIHVEPIILHRGYSDRNLRPSGGEGENDHKSLHFETYMALMITEISSSRLDRYRIRIWCETIVEKRT